ncbi:hypothetical protein M9H77_32939 [Catharanthus roseus]|uniref:Uncharacterized protein n=1 Tax=Catharanthus roseus TaxID=4058 RepID=A0ACC0A4B8_CATRO|nr:hypothetical protein M9H77_32939 [Catharanthus roseus]
MKNQDISAYLEKCRFLPKLNNEIPGHRNATYKERFSSLENLVLIMTELYKEDWIGLKTLDDAGKVKFISVPGNHLGISRSDMRKHVIPYLQDGSSSMDGSSKSGIGFSGDARRKELRMQRAAAADVVETSNGGWPSPFNLYLQVKSIWQLQNGYNIVAQSQGTLVGRGLVEFCDDAPPVMNFISMGGPQAGVASLPPCFPVCATIHPSSVFLFNDFLCNRFSRLVESGIYTDYVQANLAPSGYTKFPNDLEAYLAKCSFLPQLNNELPEKNSTYKERLTSLNNLVLIMFEEDTIVIPRESSWFGFFSDDYNGPIQFPRMTKLYREDWIGLRTLDETGRLKFISVPGEHLLISIFDTLRFVVPYLREDGMVTAAGPNLNNNNTKENKKRASKQGLKKQDQLLS